MRILPALLLLALGGQWKRGLEAYEAGRFREALEAFGEAEEQAGHEAPAELLYNRSLAALRAKALRICEFSAEKSVVRGGPSFAGLRDFLLGSAAFARAQRARAEATLREADPTAFQRAILHARNALDHWQRAATSRSDWPAARRNAERALLALDELEKMKARAEEQRQAKKAREREEQERPAEQTEAEEQDPEAQEDPGELSEQEIERILARLEETKNEKLALRRAMRKRPGLSVEKDW
ncbi:MAG: hypothetical protein ACE5F1_08180 [Planctomycetota bacterium]